MSRLYKHIAGAGGGGGKGGGGETQHVPTESPDSLRSRQYARVLDALCEGPIVGLVDGAKSIFLNDVPLQNADDTYNFSNVSVATTLGTQIQDYLPGFGNPQATTTVGVEVKATIPVVQTISAGSNLDAVQVTLGFPALSYQNPSNGDLGGASVAIAIDLQANGGGYAQMLTDTISGKTTTRYQRSYRVPLTGTGPWDIRVRRLTADSTASNLLNKTYWDLYVSLIDSKFRYPNTALVGLQVDASQFNSIPKRSYDVKLLQVSIPSNYDPITRTYSGVWNGTFITAWTDNPAWCFYDLLTNRRYGLGEFISPTQVDKWVLYSIAQYCDELVSDGYGGMEPRFTCNLYLQTRQEAYTVLMNFASIFRAITYWGSGAIYTVQDAPSTPIAQFTNANVIDGEFSYSGSSRRGRHTVALVSWNDPADNYQQKIEYVSDDAGIARYGVQQTEVVAFGCTSRGQAHRLGKWMLLSETLELEVVSFKAGLDGTSVYPGAKIRTLDRHRAGVRYGGRAMDATTTSLTIDATITLAGGISYNVTVTLPDGSLVTNTLTNIAGDTTVLTWATALPAVPLVDSVWVLAADNVNPEVWRVVTLLEKDIGQVEITALASDVNKYTMAENDLLLEPLPTSTISTTLAAPANVALSSYTYTKADGTVGARLHVAWDAVPSAIYYAVEFKRDNDNWTLIGGNIREISVETEINYTAIYTARVAAFNLIGTRSAVGESVPTAINWNVLGAPQNLMLAAAYVGKEPQMKWDAVDGAASYVVRIYDGTTLLRTVTGWLPTYYVYRLVDSIIDGGPYRDLIIDVSAADSSGTEGVEASLSIGNAQMGAPSGLLVVAGMTSLTVSAAMPTAEDYAGTKIWISTTPGFDPAATTPVYVGPNNYFTAIGLQGGIVHYIRVAHYDSFDQSGLTYSSELSSTPFSVAGGGLDVVSALPSSGMTQGDVVYLTTDDKIWRYDGTAWVTWTDGADILASSITAGKINVSNLAAISASLGTITAGNFTLNASGFIRGGQTAYNTGAGFWMGYSGAAYKFSIGNGSSYIAYDGTDLNINTPQFSIIAGAASLGSIAASGSIAVGTTGNVRGGQTAYDSGSGFFLGYSGGAYKFSIGNSAGNKITWDGTNLSLTGAIIQTSNIVAGAVSNIVNSYTAGTIDVSGAGDTTIQSAPINTTGQKVFIQFSARAPYSVTSGVYNLKLFRDTTLLWDSHVNYAGFDFYLSTDYNSMPTISLTDTPGAGTYTYKVTCNKPGGGTTTFALRSLTLQEIKK